MNAAMVPDWIVCALLLAYVVEIVGKTSVWVYDAIKSRRGK